MMRRVVVATLLNIALQSKVLIEVEIGEMLLVGAMMIGTERLLSEQPFQASEDQERAANKRGVINAG